MINIACTFEISIPAIRSNKHRARVPRSPRCSWRCSHVLDLRYDPVYAHRILGGSKSEHILLQSVNLQSGGHAESVLIRNQL